MLELSVITLCISKIPPVIFQHFDNLSHFFSFHSCCLFDFGAAKIVLFLILLYCSLKYSISHYENYVTIWIVPFDFRNTFSLCLISRFDKTWGTAAGLHDCDASSQSNWAISLPCLLYIQAPNKRPQTKWMLIRAYRCWYFPIKSNLETLPS